MFVISKLIILLCSRKVLDDIDGIEMNLYY
jgi:hypothetical protein